MFRRSSITASIFAWACVTKPVPFSNWLDPERSRPSLHVLHVSPRFAWSFWCPGTRMVSDVSCFRVSALERFLRSRSFNFCYWQRTLKIINLPFDSRKRMHQCCQCTGKPRVRWAKLCECKMNEFVVLHRNSCTFDFQSTNWKPSSAHSIQVKKGAWIEYHEH